jgi:hypothetical protein
VHIDHKWFGEVIIDQPPRGGHYELRIRAETAGEVADREWPVLW